MTGRVLVVTNDFPPRVGGIESFVLEMVRRMPPDSVVVHTARQEGDADFDAGLAFPVVRDPSRIMLPVPSITRRSVAISREYGCDAVWFGAAAPLGLMASALRRRAGVRRTVATTHGHEVWWARVPVARQLLRRIGDTNDVLTYLGEFTRSKIAPALSPAARSRMVQLTPGVDVERFHPGVEGRPVREKYGLGDRPVIVCVSRLVKRKGQDTLIKALPLVQESVPDAALLLVGDGPERSRLDRLARKLGVADDVVFAGAQRWEDTPPFYAAGDVFCMPCRTRKFGLEAEGFGIVYLEAAAVGLPVIGGKSGGAPEAVQLHGMGSVVDGGKASEVASAVVTAQQNIASERHTPEGARQWAWDCCASRLAGWLTQSNAVDPV